MAAQRASDFPHPSNNPAAPTAATEIYPMLVHDQATLLAQKRTPEGFLHIKARIGRSGLQDYKAGEIGGPPGAPPEANVRVYRPPEEVFDPASLASFAGKPVTLEHPFAMVDSGNWKQFAVGHSGGTVRRDGDHLATDLVVTDAAAVGKAQAGSELSNGYWADFDFTPGLTSAGEPYDAVQRNIRGNHIALVDQGRCGPTCTVGASGAGASGAGATDAGAVTSGRDAAATDSAGAASRTSAAAPTSVLDCPPGEVAAELSRLRSEIATRDGEIADLRARAAADVASLDRRAAERARTIDVARNLLGAGFDPTGLDLGDIRRTAVVKALGPDAVRGRNDDYVAAAFDTVAALGAGRDPLPGSRTTNPLAGHLAAGSAGAGGQAAALQDRNAYLAGAWKPDLTHGDR